MNPLLKKAMRELKALARKSEVDADRRRKRELLEALLRNPNGRVTMVIKSEAGSNGISPSYTRLVSLGAIELVSETQHPYRNWVSRVWRIANRAKALALLSAVTP